MGMNNRKFYSACFIGHRSAQLNADEKMKLFKIIKDLIEINNVEHFLFGSRSKFDDFCYGVISKFKQKYTHIKRICFTCRHESCLLESEIRNRVSKDQSNELKDVEYYEREEEFSNKYKSGRASYIERNEAMIDACDYCVFYFNPIYKPQIKQVSKKYVSTHQPNSGTKIAYQYANKKGKKIINIFDVQN